MDREGEKDRIGTTWEAPAVFEAVASAAQVLKRKNKTTHVTAVWADSLKQQQNDRLKQVDHYDN